VKRLAIDPGDIHVGYARNPKGDMEVLTGEWRPTECTTEVTHLMTKNEIDELILEEFRLYDSPEGRDQVWSSMKTSQLIGALKLIASWFRIPVIEQGAYIKTPTRNQLRARKIKQLGHGTHALDAELHLYYRMLREGN
jgi:hypothetical protein